jgi:hypothetical protein
MSVYKDKKLFPSRHPAVALRAPLTAIPAGSAACADL